MPSYTLPNMFKDALYSRVQTLATRYADNAQANFPLTAEHVQDLLLPQDIQEQMRALEARGVSLTRSHRAALALSPNSHPALERRVTLMLSNLPPATMMAKYTSASHPHEVTAEAMGRLPSDVQEDLAYWINGAVRAVRLADMAKIVVKRALKVIKNTDQLLYNWPALATVVQDSEWKARLRAVPAYRPAIFLNPFVPDKNGNSLPDKKLRTATDTVLSGALLFAGDYVEPADEIHGKVVSMEKFHSEKNLEW